MPATSEMPDLPTAVLEDLGKWWTNMTTESSVSYSPRGLWVVGSRGCGTSHVGYRALAKAQRHDLGWPTLSGHLLDYGGVSDYEDKIKEMWHLENGVRNHPNDATLWAEADAVSAQVNWWLSAAPCSMVDDLHRGDDLTFWSKHIQRKLEKKIKSGKGVIVATDMAPDAAFGSIWPNLFVVCPVPNGFLNAER